MRFLLLSLALLLAPAAFAQSAEEILRAAVAKYEAEMADVQNYTITQVVMGTEVTTYAERAEGAATLDYTHHVVMPNGLIDAEETDGSNAAPNPYLMMERIVDKARYVGTEDVGGIETHALAVDDFGDLAREFGAVPDGAEGEFDIDTATFYVGTDDARIHRMTMEGEIANEGSTSPVKFDSHLSDYRTIDGFTTPFHMKMKMEGMEGQLSDEERQQLEEARAQMEAMPAAQRKMMERMMGDKFKQLDQMLAGEGFELEMNVIDVQVNTGRPE